MSRKKHKKENQRFPWILAALGGVLLLVAAFFLAREPGGGEMPDIQVDRQKIDYGYVRFGESRSFAIRVTNSGSGTLRFEEDPYIEIIEGC